MTTNCNAQFDSNCKSLLNDYVATIVSCTNFSNNVQFLDFTLTNTYKVIDNKAPSKVNAKIYITEGRMVYQTDIASYHIDKEDAFLVLHPQRQVIWMEGSDISNNKAYREAFMSLRKDLLQSGSAWCKDTVINNRELKYIVLNYDPIIERDNLLDHVIYQYDKEKQQVTRSEIYYRNHPQLKKQVFEYTTFDTDYKRFKMVPVKEMIFSSPGILKKEFREYTLVNNKTEK